jgi:flagellar protein FlbD
MITVTRLDGSEFYLNPDLIETVEATPDTVITLTTGKKLVVRETGEDIWRKILAWRRSVARAGEVWDGSS